MKLCECGCGKEVSREGNRFLKGHSGRGKHISKEHKLRISLANTGKVCSGVTKRKMSIAKSNISDETRRKMSEAGKKKVFSDAHLDNLRKGQLGRRHTEETKIKIGNNNRIRDITAETRKKMALSLIQHGEQGLRSKHLEHKKQECIFGCVNAKKYELHHEPRMDSENVRFWEGRLVNLCSSCHRRVRLKTLNLPEDLGIKWSIQETNEYFETGGIEN